MKIEWNKVTWYSWTFAIFVAMGILLWAGWLGNTFREIANLNDTALLPAQKNISPVKTEIVTSSDLDISTWKTYKNSDFGFEIKYPAEFEKSVVIYDVKKNDIGTASSLFEINDPFRTNDPDHAPSFGIWVYAQPTKKDGKIYSDAEDLFSQEINDTAHIATSTLIDLGGTKAILYKTKFTKEEIADSPEASPSTSLVAIKDGYIFKIGEYNPLGYVEFEKMFSTFKFTN